MNDVLSGDIDSTIVRKQVILPSIFTGSPSFIARNYQGAMAICRWARYPTLFITFTYNQKWLEIGLFWTLFPIRRLRTDMIL